MKLLLMKKGTWKYINPQGGNPPVGGEPPAIIAERVKGLHSLFMSIKECVLQHSRMHRFYRRMGNVGASLLAE